MDLLLDGLADQRIDAFMRMNQEIVGGGIRSSLTPTSINNLKKNANSRKFEISGNIIKWGRLHCTAFRNDRQNNIATSGEQGRDRNARFQTIQLNDSGLMDQRTNRPTVRNCILELHGSKRNISRDKCAFLFRPWCQAGVKLASSWPGNSQHLNLIKLA